MKTSSTQLKHGNGRICKVATATGILCKKMMFARFPLHDAAERGNLDEVKRLLDEGRDINERDTPFGYYGHGYTALYLASYSGHLPIATLLLDRGASIDLQTNNGWTALISASCNGRANIVSLLLERGANLCITNKSGKTALYYARQYNQSACISLLQNYEHFHRYRKVWLSFSTSLRSFQEDQNEESKQIEIQSQIHSPSLMRVMDSSDLVRYLTEFM